MLIKDSNATTSVDTEMEERSYSLSGKEDENDVPITSTQDVNEYPKGANLAFIIIALILSIFLASLDMVINPISSVWANY